VAEALDMWTNAATTSSLAVPITACDRPAIYDCLTMALHNVHNGQVKEEETRHSCE